MAYDKKTILKKYFGYDSFRYGQEEIIDSILSFRDTLGVMPTGAGKSMCFQIPAMIFDGVTLVISPLISLMKDQVNSLTQIGIKSAFINSSLTEKQISKVLLNAKNREYKIIYVAPERLMTDYFISFAKSIDISMVTVDEAHCVSQWGQDFRPSYTAISEFIKSLEKPPVVSAFTATATDKVRNDIAEILKLTEPKILVSGFNRENLYFEVQKPKDKLQALMKILKEKKDKSGIIYCLTREGVEETCNKLLEAGYSASRYHAGLADSERHKNQEDFIYDRIQIMVATNAFGMGIDKSNVSFVIHYNMPKNIESYYQEAGRAGRDGENADCILLYGGQDVVLNTFLIEKGQSAEFIDIEAETSVKENNRRLLKEITFYCHTAECLRNYILKYFGETSEKPCGNCGNCMADYKSVDITLTAQKVLSCVHRAKERYGVNIIISVLRGSKNEKVLRLGLNKLSTYNICSESEKMLRNIINYLVLYDFLFITNDKYPILKLGKRANEVLKENLQIQMKISENFDTTEDTAAKRSDIRLNKVNHTLLNKLKALRYAIASKQGVPAFVIFSDSALIDMCMKLPQNQQDFLSVSGVGQTKLERYGTEFLTAICEFLKDTPIDSSINDTAEENTNLSVIDLLKELSEEPVTVSVISDKITSYIIQKGFSKITGAKLNEWLIFNEYIETEDRNGEKIKLPTKKGKEIGIFSTERTIRGKNCLLNYFDKNAQYHIIEEFVRKLQSK